MRQLGGLLATCAHDALQQLKANIYTHRWTLLNSAFCHRRSMSLAHQRRSIGTRNARLRNPGVEVAGNDTYMLELMLNGIAMARIPIDRVWEAKGGRQNMRLWADHVDVRSVTAIHRIVESGMIEPPVCWIALVADVAEQQCKSLHMHLAQQTMNDLLDRCLEYVSKRSAFTRSIEATEDDRQSFELSLRVIRTLVVHTSVKIMEGWSKLSRSTMAIRTFQQLVDFEEQLGTKHTQSARSQLIVSEVLDSLLVTPFAKDTLAQCALSVFEKHSGFAGVLSEDTLVALFEALYKAGDYNHIAIWIRQIPAPTINADIAKTVLLALRKQQIARLRDNRRYRKPRRSGSKAPEACSRSFFTAEVPESTDPIRFLARHVVGALGRYRRETLSAAHLTKLLEIEISAAPVSASIPRALDLWLRNFHKFGIAPTIETFTVLIDAYVRHGDGDFATQIFNQLRSGTVSFTLPDRTSVVFTAPAPNAVTWSTIARVWCQTRDWDKIHTAMAMIRQSGNIISPRLVTWIVSEAVDRGDVVHAHQFWIKHGCNGGVVVNGEALAKLVLGYAQQGDSAAATDLFERACAYQSRGAAGKSHMAAHLTGLLNAVLRCSLNTVSVDQLHVGDDVPARLGFDSQAIRIAHQFGVRFDAGTYNVLLAQLSRCVIQVIAGADQERVSLFATAMHRLYVRMHDERILLDEMTLAHLVPAWIHRGDLELVRMHWHIHVQGRTEHKIEQARRHILHQTRHWNMDDSTVDHLLDTPPPKE